MRISYPSYGEYESRDDILQRFAQDLTEELGLTRFFREATDLLQLELSAPARLMLLIPLAELDMRAVSSQPSAVNEGQIEVNRQLVETTLLDLLVQITRFPAAGDSEIQTRERGAQEQSPRFSELADFSTSSPKPRLRSSLSAIKAYAQRFCNIPPFCGETDE